MPDHFVSSRFLIWPRPLAYPKYDLITKDTNPGPVFDMNVELDSYDGSVYIKVEHVIEMARSVGMLTVEEAEKLRVENSDLRRQINKLPKAQEELKDGLDDLTARFFANLNTVDIESDGDSSDPASDDREPAKTEPTSVGPFSI